MFISRCPLSFAWSVLTKQVKYLVCFHLYSHGYTDIYICIYVRKVNTHSASDTGQRDGFYQVENKFRVAQKRGPLRIRAVKIPGPRTRCGPWTTAAPIRSSSIRSHRGQANPRTVGRSVGRSDAGSGCRGAVRSLFPSIHDLKDCANVLRGSAAATRPRGCARRCKEQVFRLV